jgi:hypothetical protein
MTDQPLPAEIQPGDLLVWYIPQVPMKAFERFLPLRGRDPEEALREAVLIQDTIIEFSAFEFENRVKPDYSDATGIARWEGDGAGGMDWYDIEEEELEELRA